MRPARIAIAFDFDPVTSGSFLSNAAIWSLSADSRGFRRKEPPADDGDILAVRMGDWKMVLMKSEQSN